MAWVRLDDAVMGNLKIMRLSDSAFRLWVKGLVYCQTHLTDGLLPLEALRDMAAKPKDVIALETVQVEGKAPLWEHIDRFGFKVHDYLDWNDSKELVLSRQTDAKHRMRGARAQAVRANQQRTNAERAENEHPPPNAHVPEAAAALVPIRLGSSLDPDRSSLERESERKPFSARSNRPLFKGQRLTVFEWMFEDVLGMLAPHGENFDLHRWFFDLDALAVASGWVVPDRDGGAWLKARTLEEAQRRGLPLALATPEPVPSARRSRMEAESAKFLRGQS